jgi:phenylacetate-CoA ligase
VTPVAGDRAPAGALTVDGAGGYLWQPEAERLPRGELGELQLTRLRATLQLAHQRVPFYRHKLDRAGVAPDDVACHGDVLELPFTTKDDLRDNYPFDLLALPRDEVVTIHCSSGTTGNPIVVGYSRADVALWASLVARTLAAGGIGPGDLLQNAFGYGLFTGGLGLHHGGELLGCTVLPISGGNTDRQLRLMRDFGATALCCTPSYALHLAEAAREQGLAPDDLHLRVGYFGAEPWSSEMRVQIEDGLGLEALDIYGLSEMGGPGVAYECRCRSGMHINEDHYLAEVVDPERLVSLPEGEVGELVITTLSRTAQPLIRYRTRDLCGLVFEPCACGRTLTRMTKPVGRSDDMLIIRGVNVFPSQIEEVLMAIPGVEPHYQIVVDRRKHLDVVEVWIEVGPALFGETMAHLAEFEHSVQQSLYSVLGIQVKVCLKEPRTIARSEGKAVRVVDRRLGPR